jgi:hypothetical protein
MANLTLDKDGDRVEPKSRRGWMLLAAGLGAALVLGACSKNHKNRDEDEDEVDPV